MVLVVYLRVVSFPFILLDDEPFLLKNPAVQAGLAMDGVRWAFSTVMDAGWIPLTWLSRLLDVSLFGMDAGKHHLVNVLLHLLNTLLLFRFLRGATGKMWESGFVAALFAVHPLHVESVAWVTERKDVLAAFFWMLSLGAYVRYAERPGIARYGAVLLFFLLGLMSKPIVVTFPFVLLLLDYWPLNRLRAPADTPGDATPRYSPAPLGSLVIEKIPLLFLSGAISALTYFAQMQIGAVTPLDATPLWARVGNAITSYGTYLLMAAWPSGLAIFYPHPGTGLILWESVLAGLFLIVITAWVVRGMLRRGWMAVGWFWYLGTLVPVIGLVQVGGIARADRCTYIPMIGIYVLAAWGLGDLSRRFRIPGQVQAGVAASWLLALAVCAWIQIGYWQGTEPLFRRALQVTENNWLAHSIVGQLEEREGRDADAVEHYREALRIWPDLPEVHNALGGALDRVGKVDEAIANFREELRIQPRFAPAHYNLGVIYYRIGRIDDAVACFRETLRIRPDHPEAHNNFGVCMLEAGRVEEAMVHFRGALRVRPDYSEAHRNLGMALSRVGFLGEALDHLREAVRLRPDYVEARNNLGVLYARLGRFPEAVTEFHEVLRLEPDHVDARGNLARAAADPRRVEGTGTDPVRSLPKRGERARKCFAGM
jgi:Flp pilus assembly protein TadD